MTIDSNKLHKIIMEEISFVPSVYNLIWLFNDCNNKYFGGELPRPIISLVHDKRSLGRFTCDFYDDDEMENPRIEISDSYEYTQSRLRDIMVHEMIHYYLAYIGEDVYISHGKAFKDMVNRFNSQYGLHMSKKVDTSDMKRTNNNSNWFTKLFS